MRYLLNRNGCYFYDRRVPKKLADFDTRQRIRLSLDTKCKKTAIKKMVAFNDNLERYWDDLCQHNETHSQSKFKQLVREAKRLDFAYVPANTILELPFVELIERVLSAKMNIDNKVKVEAVLGATEAEAINLSEALKRFWNYSKPKLLNKNSDQQRKWRNPRKKAVKNFIDHVGDKPINKINNLDLIKLRDWWLERMKIEQIKADTVNKDFTHLKGVLETVSTHEEIEMDVDKIFKKIHIKETDRQTRKAYSSEFIRNEILNPENLKTLDKEAQSILFICANTGARPIEIVNLIKEDILLGEPIPYIHIRPRQGYSLKTKESERKLPLVGIALEAFKIYPNGFNKYRSNSEKASANINNWLSKHNLRPTKKHSLYSLRHSFQDCLTALEVPDRIQCQLMGHSFKAKGRIKYGTGANIEHLRSIVDKCLHK